MLNAYIKTLSKALAKKLKEVLQYVTSPYQTAYVQNSNIVESGRLISDITEITNIRQMDPILTL